VLSNDSDADSPPSSRAVVIVPGQGPTNGSLTLNLDGSFTYTPIASFSGQDSFQYRAYNRAPDGRQLSELSAPVTVSITVEPMLFGFVNVHNLPPPWGTKFYSSRHGTPVDFEWKFTLNEVVVNSSDAQPTVTIQDPMGVIRTYSPSCASSPRDCERFIYKSYSKLWDFHWKPKHALTGTYYVIVWSGKTGQRFPEHGPGFPVVFKAHHHHHHD
jgi:hypothetical protein